MHIHAYRAEQRESGFRLELHRRLSTDADGIRAALGLQAEANIELDQIIRTLETPNERRNYFHASISDDVITSNRTLPQGISNPKEAEKCPPRHVTAR